MSDPERPALLQLIREHELGGRPVAESVGMITERSMAGAHSIAAVLHGRLGKSAPPARGQTEIFAERVPGGAPPTIVEVYQAADARQAEIGRQLAERPEPWALERWGVPPSVEESATRRTDWERRAGLVGAYREAAGITDPRQAIGPVPSGKAQLREAFHAAVLALELPGDQALLRAMGRGQLEAQVSTYQRAEALAPRDVSAELAAADRLRKSDIARAQAARDRRGGHGRDPGRDDRREARRAAGRRRGPAGMGRGARHARPRKPGPPKPSSGAATRPNVPSGPPRLRGNTSCGGSARRSSGPGCLRSWPRRARLSRRQRGSSPSPRRRPRRLRSPPGSPVRPWRTWTSRRRSSSPGRPIRACRRPRHGTEAFCPGAGAWPGVSMGIMSVLPVDPTQHEDPLDPGQILRSLPDRERETFLAEYRRAVDDARDPARWPELRRFLRLWAWRAVAVAEPGYYKSWEQAKHGHGRRMLLEDAIKLYRPGP